MRTLKRSASHSIAPAKSSCSVSRTKVMRSPFAPQPKQKGDLITFVRETEQLDFAGAIEWLADRFSVQIEYEETSPQQDARRRRRERLLELLDAAASF